MRLIISAILMGLLSSAGSLAAAPSSQPAAAPASRPAACQIVPWVECTAPTSRVRDLFPDHPAGAQRAIDYVLEGLAAWSSVSQYAIVSTHPENLRGFYEDLMKRKPPGLRLIGGVSTYSLPGCTDQKRLKPYDYADAGEWKQITDRCVHIARVTGTNAVLLENELALRRFYEGEPVDLARLREALVPLRDTGLTVFWYLPTIAEPSKKYPNLTFRTAALVRAIHEAVPKARFVCGHIGYPDWSKDPTLQWRRDVMLGAFDCIEYLFATTDGVLGSVRKKVWTPATAMAEVRRLQLEIVIVYPGFKAWTDTARRFAELE